MRFVVDASVGVKWLIVEEDADVARELATGGQDLRAPRLMASGWRNDGHITIQASLEAPDCLVVTLGLPKRR